ncbi:hypothetical protein ACXG6S_001120 [Campylobacter jejuni]
MTEGQENAQKTYDTAANAYNEAVKAYNTALSGITGNNGDKVIAGLKQAVDKVSSDLQQAVDKVSSDLQQATIALQIATANTNSSLENSNKTLASASINGTSHLTVNENIVQTISQYPL